MYANMTIKIQIITTTLGFSSKPEIKAQCMGMVRVEFVTISTRAPPHTSKLNQQLV